MNEELEENHLQTEHDLREELEMNNNKVREVKSSLCSPPHFKSFLHFNILLLQLDIHKVTLWEEVMDFKLFLLEM